MKPSDIGTKLVVSKEAIELATKEFLLCHDFLDAEGVTREHNGEKLSLSQRLRVYVDERRGVSHSNVVNLAAARRMSH